MRQLEKASLDPKDWTLQGEVQQIRYCCHFEQQWHYVEDDRAVKQVVVVREDVTLFPNLG